MKISSILKVAVLALPLFMASCHVHKKAVKDTPETVVFTLRTSIGFMHCCSI